MENKSHALAAGVFVLAVTALLIAMALWLTRDVANTVAYELSTVEAVSGLQVQAPVRYKGVAVGKVSRIGFDPQQRGHVLVTLAISPHAPITGSTYAALAYQGVTGLSFVQLDDTGGDGGPLSPGPNGVPRIPLQPNALGQITDQAARLMERFEQVTDSLNTLLAPDKQDTLVQSIAAVGTAASQAGDLAQTLQQTVRTGLDPALGQMPALLEQVRGTLRTTEEAAAQARQSMQQLSEVVGEAQQGLHLLTGEGGMIERMDEGASTVTSTTLPRIQLLTEDASRTIRRLDRLVNTLSDNPQALLYGSGSIDPGPGEEGFVPPRATPESPVLQP